MNEDEAFTRLSKTAQSGQTEELLRQAERYLSEDDSVSFLYLFKGRALQSMGKLDEAIAALREAIMRDPDDAVSRATYGSALLQKGLYVDALNACDGAVLIDDELPESYLFSGNALVAMGFPERAVFPYHKAYTLAPSRQLGELVATLYAQNNQISEAMDVFFDVLKDNPNDYVTNFKIGVTLMYFLRSGAVVTEAVQRWLELVKNNPIAREISSALLHNDIAYNPMTQTNLNYLFSSFAASYDERMAQGEDAVLRLIRENLRNIYNTMKVDICDLGCGTGLCGAIVKPFAQTLVGVDLCTEMLDKAYDKKIYDRLYNTDNMHFLRQNTRAFDIIAACDVFPYTQQIFDTIAAMKTSLKEQGTIVFSFKVNQMNDDKSMLYPPFYYLFNHRDVEQALQANGFKIKLMQPVQLNERVDQSFETILCIAHKMQ